MLRIIYGTRVRIAILFFLFRKIYVKKLCKQVSYRFGPVRGLPRPCSFGRAARNLLSDARSINQGEFGASAIFSPEIIPSESNCRILAVVYSAFSAASEMLQYLIFTDVFTMPTILSARKDARNRFRHYDAGLGADCEGPPEL